MMTGPEKAYYEPGGKHSVSVKKRHSGDAHWRVEVTLFKYHRAPHRQTYTADFYDWGEVAELVEVIRLFEETRQRENDYDHMTNLAELEERHKQAREAYQERKKGRLEDFKERIQKMLGSQVEPEATHDPRYLCTLS